MPAVQRRADGAARVAGRGLDPEVLERPLAQQDTIGDAVERDATRETRVAFSGGFRGRARHREHDVFGDDLDRRRKVELALGDLRFGRTRRSAEQVGEAAVRHREPGEVVEVLHLHAERAVGPQVEQVLTDGVGVDRLPVRREPHELVLARVHPEAAEVGERGVEEAERVGEVELALQLDVVAATHPDAAGGPLPHAVEGEDRRALERRREERARRVALVVLGEPEVLGHRCPDALQPALDLVGDPELLTRERRHRRRERADALGADAQVRLEQTDERGDRLVVVHDRVDAFGADVAALHAVRDRALRERGVVLLASEALLLGRGHELAVDDERGGRVVVERADPEDLHRLAAASARARSCGSRCE